MLTYLCNKAKLNTNIDYTNPNIYSKDWTSEIDQTYQSEVA